MSEFGRVVVVSLYSSASISSGGTSSSLSDLFSATCRISTVAGSSAR